MEVGLCTCHPVLLWFSSAELKTVWKHKSCLNDMPAAQEKLTKD